MPLASRDNLYRDLMDSLREIQRLTTAVGALLDEGLEQYEQFKKDFDAVLDRMAPRATVAVVGPVSSGKSTILSILLQQAGTNPIAAVNAANESAAPLIFSYALVPRLTVSYFSVAVLQQIDKRLDMTALYKDIRARLLRIDAVRAGRADQPVVEMFNLEGKTRHQMAEIVHTYTAQSSPRPEVDGVYKAELSYPNPVLADMPAIRLVDMSGFGEPNPLTEIKFTRFASEERLDAILYVSPGQAVTDDFHRLFELPGFVDAIVARRRLFIVLNKADSYPGVKPSGWGKVRADFRKTVARVIPAMRGLQDDIPLYVMSAASIDQMNVALRQDGTDLRRESGKALNELRSEIGRMAESIQADSGDPALHFGQLFDILGALEALSEGVERSISQIESRLPGLAKSIDELASRKALFDGGETGRLDGLRALMRARVTSVLGDIDYENYLKEDTVDLVIGDPSSLYRWMNRTALATAIAVLQRQLLPGISHVVDEVNNDIQSAYGAYAREQDQIAKEQSDAIQAPGVQRRQPILPLWLTIEQFSRELPRLSRQPAAQFRTQAMFTRFLNWYFQQRCTWDAARGQSLRQVRDVLLRNAQAGVEAFAVEYFCCGAASPGVLRAQVCTGGEVSFWDDLEGHVHQLEELLAEQVRLTAWKFSLYEDRKYFVSRRPDYERISNELRHARVIAEQKIVDLA